MTFNISATNDSVVEPIVSKVDVALLQGSTLIIVRSVNRFIASSFLNCNARDFNRLSLNRFEDGDSNAMQLE
jgi:hypothetical protein